MDNADHRRVVDLLFEAAQRPPNEREAFLREACAGDDDLRCEVESLLPYSDCAADAFSDATLEEQRQRICEAAGAAWANARSGEGVVGERDASDLPTDWAKLTMPYSLHGEPVRLGDYHIERRLGEGGMSYVYEAEQAFPRRRLALKVLKPGAASPRLVERLRREANLLARLQHPGIAQVFDAGVAQAETSGGAVYEQAYFAMELIEGEHLDEFALRRGLDDRARLRLMADVCAAVDHAHLRGVLHRDLKFSNIIVTPEGRPKVLDFGVSRLMETDVHTLTLETKAGELLGTVPYMSPEQVAGDGSGLDARSDVYALGVLCFELLAGRLPYEIRRASIPEAIRVIRFEEPLALRTVDARFAGDVDTIVGKAVEKDPERRYASAGALGADIERHLANEPIAARPAGAMYLLGKFARRNKALVGGVAAVFLTMLAGLAVSSWFAWQAAAERDAANVQRDVAQREARRVAALNAFLVDDLFGAADPTSGTPLDRDVRGMLEDASATVDTAFADEPDIEALVRTALGKILRKVGEYEASEEHLRRALAIAEDLYGPDAAETYEPRYQLARTLWRKNVFAEARELLTLQLALQRSAGADEESIVATLGAMGDVDYESGRYAEAEATYRDVLERLEAMGAEDSDAYLEAMNDVANVAHNQGRFEESIALHRRVLEAKTARDGEESLPAAMSMHNLGTILIMVGETAEAKTLLEEALVIRKHLLGEESVDAADTLQQLGRVYLRERDIDKAREFTEQAVAMFRKLLPENHTRLALTLDLRAKIAARERDFATQEQCLRESYAMYLATEGPTSRATAVTLGSVAVSLMWQERFEESVEVHREALELTKAAFGEDHVNVHLCETSLGACLLKAGRYAEAEERLRSGWESLRRLGSNGASWAGDELEELYAAWDRPEELAAFRAEREAAKSAAEVGDAAEVGGAEE